eukprot:gene7645-9403_t
MSSLKELYLSNNQIQSIPPQIVELTLYQLEIQNNPIVTPPPQIVDQEPTTITTTIKEDVSTTSSLPSPSSSLSTSPTSNLNSLIQNTVENNILVIDNNLNQTLILNSTTIPSPPPAIPPPPPPPTTSPPSNQNTSTFDKLFKKMGGKKEKDSLNKQQQIPPPPPPLPKKSILKKKKKEDKKESNSTPVVVLDKSSETVFIDEMDQQVKQQSVKKMSKSSPRGHKLNTSYSDLALVAKESPEEMVEQISVSANSISNSSDSLKPPTSNECDGSSVESMTDFSHSPSTLLSTVFNKKPSLSNLNNISSPSSPSSSHEDEKSVNNQNNVIPPPPPPVVNNKSNNNINRPQLLPTTSLTKLPNNGSGSSNGNKHVLQKVATIMNLTKPLSKTLLISPNNPPNSFHHQSKHFISQPDMSNYVNSNENGSTSATSNQQTNHPAKLGLHSRTSSSVFTPISFSKKDNNSTPKDLTSSSTSSPCSENEGDFPSVQLNRERRGTIASELDLKNYSKPNRFVTTSLMEILKDEYGRDCFKSFLLTEYSEENLDFWLKVESYRQLSPEEKSNESMVLYEQFITEKSAKQINLPSLCVKRIDESLLGPNGGNNIDTLFDESQNLIFKLMESDKSLQSIGRPTQLTNNFNGTISSSNSNNIGQSTNKSQFWPILLVPLAAVFARGAADIAAEVAQNNV